MFLDIYSILIIISRSSNDINVFPPKSTYNISDRCFAECQLSIPGTNMLVKEVSYRKFKQIDMDNFRSDIASSVLCNSQWTSLEELAQCYDTTLLQILDKQAPVNTKILTVRPRVPWFSMELKKLKISPRKLEKKMLKSRSQQDKDAFREVCNNYSMSLKDVKQRYYSDLIEECGGDTRKLFQVVRSLSNKPEENQLPPHDDPCKLADDFGEFFCRKVDLIRNDIDAITVVPPVLNVPTPENKFEKFDVLSEEEVSDIIMGSSNASCQLDPIPTWLLKLCGSELIPVITKMINLSLQQGQVPDSWKAALIRPLLKKLELELVYKIFRPVSTPLFTPFAALRQLWVIFSGIALIMLHFEFISHPIVSFIQLIRLFLKSRPRLFKPRIALSTG